MTRNGTPDGTEGTAGNRAILRTIREREVEEVLSFLPSGAAVLEIGAGAGWQARIFAAHGHPVEAIDLPQSGYRDAAVWPVMPYDGVHIPFPDAKFDVIFSSNVLEHVESLETLMEEMRRVLRPGGLAIHLLPTSSWRIWATVSHYALVARRLLTRGRSPALVHGDRGPAPDPGAVKRPGARRLARFVPPPHGARGNFLTEVYWFSRGRWLRFFRRHGWRVLQCVPNKLFYARLLTLRSEFSIERLRRLSFVLGSSCLIYVLQPEKRSQRGS
jgi:SAM-dependent methyltransferase